ncbi:strictosidine synthase [Apostasia shenzhenica]|uniref:Strictosidine synthase n=1 Tax=Apostasia shenzhenica TaxID=1088818 RepID=A0A2H9ZXU3_9ASPA|nr:strictosidine synthase [Apostasia shenzhenica]
MEKKGFPAVKEDNAVLLPNPRLFFLALLLALVFVDPFRLGPLAGHDFRPVKREIAPYDEVMNRWPADGENRIRSGRLEFVDQVFGPESIEFDRHGRGPYAGLADGRVVRWMGEDVGWETFAVVTPNWSERVCANGADSTTTKQHKKEQLCGRPLGLRFHKNSGDLYIADAYFGLMLVGEDGGVATPLATQAQGRPILFANDLDIHENGSVFFTDSSMRYNRRDHFLILLEGEATGRLLRYDPMTELTHVVLEGLAFPNGVQISRDQSFLLFTETSNCRVMRYWLEGEQSGELEKFADLPGFPDNVRMNERGQFWVAVDCCRTRRQDVFGRNPWLTSIYFRLPLKLSFLARRIGMTMYTVVALFDGAGEVVAVLQDRQGMGREALVWNRSA